MAILVGPGIGFNEQISMAEFDDLAGSYVGRPRIREGMEGQLAAPEKMRFLKSTETIPLELKPDGSFLYKKTTQGQCRREGDRLFFQPAVFNGTTKEQMERSAEEAGRVFGLAWLFNPFSLKIAGSGVLVSDDRSIIYTEYTRG